MNIFGAIMYVSKDGSVRKRCVSPCEWMSRFFESFWGAAKKAEPFKTFAPTSCAPSG